MSETQRGERHPMYGRKHSDESLAKMRRRKRATAKRGPDNPNWKGGTYRARGYVMVAVATLPETERTLFASMATRSSHKAIPEHRLVMARKMGRALLRSEIVHHRNGTKDDNRLRTLELHDNATHKQTHQSIMRELRALRRENERLRSLLATYLPDGADTSEIAG
jgi:hypothetical protein